VIVAALSALVMLAKIAAAQASPWAETGDAQLRSDIDLLAAAGVIDNITTHWPLPWAGLMDSLKRPGALSSQPPNIVAAADRVMREAQEQVSAHRLHGSATVDVASKASFIRGFDALGRGDAEAQVSGEMIWDRTAIRISVGAQRTRWRTGEWDFLPDGSYVAQRVGNAIIYGGYLTHWWGPGWISALSLSNNARPFPHIGIERIDTSAFENPWLSWLGPWQAEFLVGILDGPRVDRNTLYNALRFTFNPWPGLEVGLVRTEEFCGEHHPCNPIVNYFNLQNDPNAPNKVNDQGDIDVRYTHLLWGRAFEVYAQFMNEDSNPFIHSASSHLVGGSVWIPIGDTTARITSEYTDTIPTRNIFSFGNVIHGAAYNNYDYVDGMRYRGQSLGFSLDSDSRLASLQASWIDERNWTYTLSIHRAWISTPENSAGNVVTTAPVTIDLAEARMDLPLSWATVALAWRIQDDQPRPDHGYAASFEAVLRFHP
jgi:Capsule assembly protein Wzi